MATEKISKPTEDRLRVLSPTGRELWLDAASKSGSDLRIFDADAANTNPLMRRVFKTYLNMHTNQTVDFVTSKHEDWLQFNHGEYTVMEALDFLHQFLDESDPDVEFPNDIHAYQTAERARANFPDEDWFHLTGLIHDLGKVMAVWGEAQWAVVGDTFVLGCEPRASVVFRDSTFAQNPDTTDPRYQGPLGMYDAHCGLDQVLVSWGHDEYMYQVLRNHPECSLPPEALRIIRYHSLYPWHSGGDYWDLADQSDLIAYYWIREFNKCDLYSKTDFVPDMEELKPYYQGLIDKYLPGKIRF